jgi:hypothetical protein
VAAREEVGRKAREQAWECEQRQREFSRTVMEIVFTIKAKLQRCMPLHH